MRGVMSGVAVRCSRTANIDEGNITEGDIEVDTTVL